MPGQQCGRRDDPRGPQRAGQQPGQSGQDGPVRPGVHARAGDQAAEGGVLLAQDENLDILGRRAAGEQTKPTEQPLVVVRDNSRNNTTGDHVMITEGRQNRRSHMWATYATAQAR